PERSEGAGAAPTFAVFFPSHTGSHPSLARRMSKSRISGLIAAVLCLLSLQPIAFGEERKMVVLEVRYVPNPGTDIEHGQGAIERNELEHCPLTHVEWLIRVPAPGDPAEWRRRLDASVAEGAGRFEVKPPTAEALRRLEAGECTFQS
ncbi:MAG: hypothetical protein ACRD2J_00450, partial [Thermoanaerobaculia bacterium]